MPNNTFNRQVALSVKLSCNAIERTVKQAGPPLAVVGIGRGRATRSFIFTWRYRSAWGHRNFENDHH
jgi:hypothetical protein